MNSSDISLLTVPLAKHLAGFIAAPAYPGTAPLVAKAMTPIDTPTSMGP